jgi:hypothetical protein
LDTPTIYFLEYLAAQGGEVPDIVITQLDGSPDDAS